MKCSIYCKKADETIVLDFADLPQTSQDYIINYGLKQSLNDSMASAQGPNEAKGFLLNRVDKLQSGTMGLIRQKRNPLENEALKLARRLIRSKVAGIDKETLETKAREFAKDQRILDKAQTILDEQRALDGLEIDLDALGG